jgi:CelD/BcsL family acetyltransferase involved in cellulose biosynthesis
LIEEIRNGEEFRALRPEWSDLLGDSDTQNVFLTWEWLYTWWEHLGAPLRPVLLTVRRQGRLEAVAPFVARGWDVRRLQLYRSLAFLGTPLRSGNVGSDYLDVIVRRGCPEALAELGTALTRRGRVLDLAQVAGDGSAVDRLVQGLRATEWSVRSQDTGLCPVVDLAGHTWDSYLASRGREHRYGVQRKLRGLGKAFDVRFESASTEAARGPALRVLLDLHQRRWRDKKDADPSDAFSTPALRAFHETFTRLALERGWLRLFVLRLNGADAAALYGLRYGRTFSFYQSGFDPAYARYGVGAVTMALSIQAAIEEGADLYDLLHGTEEYKFHWANRTRPLVRMAAFPPRPQGRVAAVLAAAAAHLRPVARRVLLHS